MQAMCRDSRRSHRAGAVRRRAADRHGLPRRSWSRPPTRARSPCCPSISTRRRATGASCAMPTAASPPSSSISDASAGAAARFARSTPASWRRRPARLREWLLGLGRNNAQREYYLTDVVAGAVRAGDRVEAVPAASAAEVMGVNDKIQLAQVEACYRRRAGRGADARGRDAGRSCAHRHSRRRRGRARRVHRRQRGPDRQRALGRAASRSGPIA